MDFLGGGAERSLCICMIQKNARYSNKPEMQKMCSFGGLQTRQLYNWWISVVFKFETLDFVGLILSLEV